MGNDDLASVVQIHLGGHLSFYDIQKRSHLSLCLVKPMPLSNLLDQLGIPASEIFLAVIDGQQVVLTDITVSPGDTVALYPPMGGG